MLHNTETLRHGFRFSARQIKGHQRRLVKNIEYRSVEHGVSMEVDVDRGKKSGIENEW
jgi:hypothetical protein